MSDAESVHNLADDFVGERGKSRRPAGVSARRMRDAQAEAQEAMRTGDWSGASASTMVALYAVLHERVYGVACAMSPRERLFAARSAGQMLKASFADDPGAMAGFMRWAWKREAEREQWRRDNGRSGGRIGWRLQFGSNLLTDWRVDEARRAGR